MLSSIGIVATSSSLTGPAAVSAGQSAVFTDTVSAHRALVSTGTVSFYDGTKLLGTAAVNSNGVATLATSGLLAGNQSITADYQGTALFIPSTSSVLHVTVGKASDSLAVSLSSTSATAGQPFTLGVTINGPAVAGTPRSGTISVDLGTKVLSSINIATTKPSSSGSYPVTVPSGLPTGSDALTVVYSGDANYAGSSKLLAPVSVVAAAASGVSSSGGSVTISTGNINGGNTSSTGGTITTGGNTLSGGSVSGGVLTVTGPGSSGLIQGSGGSVTLSAGNMFTGGAGPIQGGLSMSNIGSSAGGLLTNGNTLNLAGVNTFTGSGTISVGTLSIGTLNLVGSGPLATISNGTSNLALVSATGEPLTLVLLTGSNTVNDQAILNLTGSGS